MSSPITPQNVGASPPAVAPPPYESCITSPPAPPSTISPTSSRTSSIQPSPSSCPLPLRIPTKKYPLSSGFPYHSSIFHLGISPDVWASFSDEIVQATKLSLKKQSLAWTSGIGIGLVSVAAVPPFGAAAGVFAGKAVYDKSILSKVKRGLEEGKLGEVLNSWNKNYWREKGVVIRLVMKQQRAEPQEKKERKKDQRREAGRFELVIDSAITNSSGPVDANRRDAVEVEVDDTPSNHPPAELGNRSVAELGNRSAAELSTTMSGVRMPASKVVNEKVALANATRSSWETAGLQGQSPLPRYITTHGHGRTNNTDEPESPISEVSGGSEDLDNRPVSAIEETYPYDRMTPVTESPLAPAPLFSR